MRHGIAALALGLSSMSDILYTDVPIDSAAKPAPARKLTKAEKKRAKRERVRARREAALDGPPMTDETAQAIEELLK